LRLWLWWTLATALGFGLGFGVAFAVLIPFVAMSDWAALSPFVASLVTVAWIQSLVLRRHRPGTGWWVPATAAGALVGSALVSEWQRTVPRHLLSVTAIHDALPRWFPLLTLIFISMGLGVALVVAIAQALVLRPITGWKRAAWWVLAAGVASIMVTLLETGPASLLLRLIPVATAGLLVALAVQMVFGAVSGLVTGAALVWILRKGSASSGPALPASTRARRAPFLAGAALTLALIAAPIVAEGAFRVYPPVSAGIATGAVVDDLKRIHPDYTDLRATSVRYVPAPWKVYNSQGQMVASQGRGPIVLLGFIPVPDSFALPPGPVWIVEFDAPGESFNGYQLVNAITGELEGGGRTHY
jgi:hypothetical protein